MCKTSKSFQTSFLKFFFPKATFDDITKFEREHADGDSRPDFYIKNGNDEYLIEVKINDRNQHFGQYDGTFKIGKERLGYITNYQMKQEGYEVHTWEEFYDFLFKALPDIEEEKKLWQAYLDYLKNVCRIIKMTKKMNLDGMYSLFEFYDALSKKILNVDTDQYHIEPYESEKDTHNGGNLEGTPKNGIMGKYFYLNYVNSPIKESWGWIGVYFEREHPLICMGFENNEGWGKPICDIIPESCVKSLPKGEYYQCVYYDPFGLWFDLSDEKRKEFSNALDLNSQIDILKSYVDEVVRLPLKLLSQR